MALCTDVLGSTLMVTSQKKCSAPLCWLTFWGILGPMSAMFLCLLRTFNISSWTFVGITDCHYTNKKIIKKLFRSGFSLLTGYFVLFLGPFWHILLFFLRAIQYFRMERCTDVLDITLMVSTFFWHHVHLCWRGHFGVFLGLFSCSSLSWELCNILSRNCVQMCLVVLSWSLHQNICLVPLCWGPGHFGGFFRLILAYKCSSISWKLFNIFS